MNGLAFIETLLKLPYTQNTLVGKCLPTLVHKKG